MRLSRTILLPTGLAMTLGFGMVREAAPVRRAVSIRRHRFEPSELRVPAGRPIIIEVANADPTAEAFDSADLGVARVITGGAQAAIWIEPMEPGRYTFAGEYHSDTAIGTLVVEPDPDMPDQTGPALRP